MPWKKGAVRRSPSCSKEYIRNYNLMRNYGITTDDYDSMYESQGGRCAICLSTSTNYRSKYFVVDHCHDTGQVRGLLCHKCNSMLGHADDNTTTLENAINYLKSA